jgi:hypothetical protein
MPDYQEMYAKLFNQITNVIEELQQIQRQTEELYMQSKEPKIILVEHDTTEKKTHSTK